MSRPDGQTWFLILFVVSILLHFLFPLETVVVPPYTYAGFFMGGAGLALCGWTRCLFLQNQTTMSPFESPVFLITAGPFRISRNPAYLGMALILLGLALLLGTLAPFAMPVLFILIIERVYIPIEERMLTDRFGDRYKKYQTAVRRWI